MEPCYPSQSAKQKVRASLRSIDAATRAICMMRAIAPTSADTRSDQIDQFVDDNDDVGSFARNLDIVFAAGIADAVGGDSLTGI